MNIIKRIYGMPLKTLEIFFTLIMMILYYSLLIAIFIKYKVIMGKKRVTKYTISKDIKRKRKWHRNLDTEVKQKL